MYGSLFWYVPEGAHGQTPKERGVADTQVETQVMHLNDFRPSEPVKERDEFDGIEFTDSLSEDTKALEPVLFRPKQRNPYFKFRLSQASMEAAARGEPEEFAVVRLVNLTDRMQTRELAHDVDALVQNLFFQGERMNQDAQKKKSKEQRMAEVQKRTREVAYAYGCAGFVKPKLVLTREQAREDEGIYFVGDVPLADLTEFVRVCEGNEELAASRLTAFSD
jgi:hypothetical protein